MRYYMKWFVGVFLAVLLGAIGFWFGEGAFPPLAEVPIIAGVIGCLLVVFMVSGKPLFKMLCGVLSLVLYVVAFVYGSLSFNRAFNECVKRGDEVRVQLSEYHQKKNQYPEDLSQLEIELCGRISRPTVLEYERTKDGLFCHSKTGLLNIRQLKRSRSWRTSKTLPADTRVKLTHSAPLRSAPRASLLKVKLYGCGGI